MASACRKYITNPGPGPEKNRGLSDNDREEPSPPFDQYKKKVCGVIKKGERGTKIKLVSGARKKGG